MRTNGKWRAQPPYACCEWQGALKKHACVRRAGGALADPAAQLRSAGCGCAFSRPCRFFHAREALLSSSAVDVFEHTLEISCDNRDRARSSVTRRNGCSRGAIAERLSLEA